MKIFKLSNTFCLLSLCSPYFVLILFLQGRRRRSRKARAGAQSWSQCRALAILSVHDIHSTISLCCFTNLRTFGYKSIIQDWYNLSLVTYPYLGYINFNLSMVKIHIPVYHLLLHTQMHGGLLRSLACFNHIRETGSIHI